MKFTSIAENIEESFDFFDESIRLTDSYIQTESKEGNP
jgi:hypothetical protein